MIRPARLSSYDAATSVRLKVCRHCWQQMTADRPGVAYEYPASPRDLALRDGARAHVTATLLVHVECFDALEGAGKRTEIEADITRGDRAEVYATGDDILPEEDRGTR